MHPNRIGRRVVDCTDMYWAADRIGGPVGKTKLKCTETEALSGKCRAGARSWAHGPGLLPAGLTGKRPWKGGFSAPISRVRRMARLGRSAAAALPPPENFLQNQGGGALNSRGRVKLTNDTSTRLSPWPKARKSHGDAFPCILIACTALHLAECTVGGGGTRGGYYQQRLEWRSWPTGRISAEALSQRRNAVTTFNIFQLSSPGVFTAKFCLWFAYTVPRSYPDPPFKLINGRRA